MFVAPKLEDIAGYCVTSGFAILGVVQLATEDLTGLGMLAIAVFSAYSSHVAKVERAKADVVRAENERLVIQTEGKAKERESALAARIKLLAARIPCDHDHCPVILAAAGRIGPMESIRFPDGFPLDRPKPCQPSEDTVDLP